MKQKNNNLIYLLFIILMLSFGFSNFFIDSFFAIKPYMFVVILIVCYFLLIRDLKFDKFTNYEILLMSFWIVCLMTFFQFRYPYAVLRYVFALLFIVIVYFVIKKALMKISIERIEKVITSTGLILSIISLIYYIMGLFAFDFNFYYNGIQRYGVVCDRTIPRLVTLFNPDPNIAVLFSSFFFFFYLCNLKKKYSKIGAVLTGIIIIMTFSRGAYIGIAVGIIALIVIDKEKKVTKKILESIFIILLLFSFNFIMVKKFNFSVFETVSYRFSSIKSDNGSGRKELWLNAIDTFLDYPVFGIGINSTLDYAAVKYGTNHYIHNVYLEVLSETGIIGFTTYMLFLVSVFRMIKKTYITNKSALFIYIVFISYLFQMMFLSVLLSEYFYILVAFAYRYNKENMLVVKEKEK